MIIGWVGWNISRSYICIATITHNIINVACVDISFAATANAVAWLNISIICIIIAYIIVGRTICSIATVTITTIYVAAVRTRIVAVIASIGWRVIASVGWRVIASRGWRVIAYLIIETVICIVIWAKSNSIYLFELLLWVIDYLLRGSSLFFTNYSRRWLISISPNIALPIVFPISRNSGNSDWWCSNIVGVDWTVRVVGFVINIVIVVSRLR